MKKASVTLAVKVLKVCDNIKGHGFIVNQLERVVTKHSIGLSQCLMLMCCLKTQRKTCCKAAERFGVC